MSEDGFNKDDLSSTFARFTSKRSNIVYDESKLKLKKTEPMSLPSATSSLGGAVLSGVASAVVASSPKKIDDKEFRKDRPWLWFSWERREDFE